MKTVCISLCVVVLLAVVLQSECRTADEQCYFNCMRALFSCKRSSTQRPCCPDFIECAKEECGVKKPKCSGQKRGSWNKRFEYDSADSMEYPNLFLK